MQQPGTEPKKKKDKKFYLNFRYALLLSILKTWTGRQTHSYKEYSGMILSLTPNPCAWSVYKRYKHIRKTR